MRVDLAPVAGWWALRSRREQVLLTVMLVLLAAVAGWYGLVQPLRAAAGASSAARSAAMGRFAAATAMSQKIQSLQGRFGPPLTSAALEAAVAESAAAGGVQLDRRETEGAILTVWSDAADPKAFFAWLNQLQSRRGIAVRSLTVAPASGGRVQVQAGLSGA